ncbi:helix-turn-helix domain-containing protein [Natronosalvus caseinilyticus]|uniref:helix-turn-helix domain-containing protein n=1 Tax=Natronosalvus caseinilyticus TaxID=2953747 RepID=UPI0028A5C6AB|nr:helix-turn-helix domain-containing protein [Natronosalvus caseinilyticus]
MSVIVEFTIEAEAFTLGRVLSGPPVMRIELERIVPTGTLEMPFVWATGTDFNAFETKVRDSPYVKELRALDRIGDSGLYRVEWNVPREDNLMEGIAQTNATVLEARGGDTWEFRLRFNNHHALSQFHNYCVAHDFPLFIERTYTLQETTGSGHQLNLSQKQREALVLALQRGYFGTPRETSLDELADELSLSKQALSDRIRRGNEKVLRSVLLSSVANSD